ncbi:hypothetical protein LCGC14_0871870 [marine sediment metagenome]|uniref:RNA ligase domain-containing protein n=1 Tax=marine sediment metagenome TaxID=412755 RepID=A0A0F9PQ10_9ZZZZ
MSTHTCDVIKIKLEPHPNAQNLSIVHIGGYECAVRTADWKDGDLATFIPPESVCPDIPDFAFLNGHFRIRVKKFRGRYSQGLLMPAPLGAKEGDDVMEQMGITHYEPPLPMSTGGDNEIGPPGFFPKYDVENFNRYGHLFEHGEEVVITEKLHGSNALYIFWNGRIWAGSRTNWKKEDEKNIWWKGLRQNPWIETWCKDHPGLVVYGEIFGFQNLKYGAGQNDIFFRAFDILNHMNWLNYSESRIIGLGLEWVPLVYKGPFNETLIREFAELDSLIPGAKHKREGIVVKPIKERQDPRCGRVQLKIVSNRYLAKAE